MRIFSCILRTQSNVMECALENWSLLSVLGLFYVVLGELTGVESYLSFDSGPSGYVGNDGTWQSAIHGFANQGQLKALRKRQNFDPIRYPGPRLPNRLFENKVFRSNCRGAGRRDSAGFLFMLYF